MKTLIYILITSIFLTGIDFGSVAYIIQESHSHCHQNEEYNSHIKSDMDIDCCEDGFCKCNCCFHLVALCQSVKNLSFLPEEKADTYTFVFNYNFSYSKEEIIPPVYS